MKKKDDTFNNDIAHFVIQNHCTLSGHTVFDNWKIELMEINV